MLERVKEWWNNNIEFTNNDDKLISTELWNKFKKDNKEYVGENKMTIEHFKDTITSNMVKSSNYIEKAKKGSIEFIGFAWKEEDETEIENKFIEKSTVNQIDNLELDNAVIEKKNKTKKV
jgi:hypothetical protein